MTRTPRRRSLSVLAAIALVLGAAAASPVAAGEGSDNRFDRFEQGTWEGPKGR